MSMMDSTVKVSRYTVLNHDGRRYEVQDDLVVSEQHRLLVRMASDYEVDEKFTRRADGTNMLLNSNGELIVRFPGKFQPGCHFVKRIPISTRHYISFDPIKKRRYANQRLTINLIRPYFSTYLFVSTKLLFKLITNASSLLKITLTELNSLIISR